uniref:Uncharacterized protein n=1 Tax=Anguilla anguilla TaxID=7936 RepID=A0A0E9U4P7_ANGAN
MTSYVPVWMDTERMHLRLCTVNFLKSVVM